MSAMVFGDPPHLFSNFSRAMSKKKPASKSPGTLPIRIAVRLWRFSPFANLNREFHRELQKDRLWKRRRPRKRGGDGEA